MVEAELGNFENACDEITRTFSEENLFSFVEQLDQIPIILANSTSSFHQKLISVTEAGLFTTLRSVLTNPLDPLVQLKLLKFWDFLVSTCSSVEELTLVFDDQVTNMIILYPFDFSSTEVLQSYVTVLKGISMKANEIDISMLFTSDRSECPLYSHSVPFIVSKDSIVVAAARLVVLNMCLIKDPLLQSFISDERAPFAFMINNLNVDELSFLADFVDVAPYDLVQFTLSKLEAKLRVCDVALLAKAAKFLEASKAKSLIMRVVSERIHTFPVTIPLTLGLLLFALDRKLILLDWAVKFGLIDRPVFETFSGDEIVETESCCFREEIKQVLLQKLSVPMVALPLRILEKLYKEEPPKEVFMVNNALIDDLKAMSANEIMEYLLGKPDPRQRCDLDYLLSMAEHGEDEISRVRLRMNQLCEVQAAIGRWKLNQFAWFRLEEVEGKVLQSFVTVDGRSLKLTSSQLFIGETESIDLLRVYVSHRDGKGGKSVTLTSVQNDISAGESRRSTLLSQIKSQDHEFRFASLAVADSFVGELENIHREMVHAMLDQMSYKL